MNKQFVPIEEIRDKILSSQLFRIDRYPIFIYFIQDNNGFIKIGVTKNIKKRFPQIKSNHFSAFYVLKIIYGTYNLESKLKKRFKKYQAKGEWFYPNEKILKYINSLNQCALPNDVLKKYSLKNHVQIALTEINATPNK